MKKTLILITVTLLIVANGYARNNVIINSGTSTLSFIKAKGGSYYPKLKTNKVSFIYQQTNPLICEIVTADSTYWLKSAYQSVSVNKDKTILCSGIITTYAGSQIQFSDTYRPLDNNVFAVERTATVLKVNATDMGFSTRISFMRDVETALTDYDFLVPGLWYKDNAYVTKRSLASNYSDNEFWFREDRLPLPFIMLRDKKAGATFSIAHKDPIGSTYKEESGLERIIDERLQFASVGLRDNKHPEIGITYPGSEGERTYIKGSDMEKRWANRNHPMTKGFTHNYKVAFCLNAEDSYVSALKNTWDKYYGLFSPSIYACNLDIIYDQQIAVLDKYWKSINNTAGLPFCTQLNGKMATENDYNFNMGFVGHQPGNASLLIREGLKTDNANLLSKGEQMADFWADYCVSSSGCPKTWYDPYPQTWRGPEVALREMGDGMIELLRAWNYEQQYKRDKPNWLTACTKVANWIVSTQLEDGAFYSHFDYNTGKPTKTHTNCTSHIIPFLVEIYMATGNDTYKNAALKAGDFIYDDIMTNFRYVGGAIDNPNVMDKEAGSMAFRAFLALNDVQSSKKWMDAVMQTAYFYRSWVVCWDIPIPADDEKAIFPASRSLVGQSIIATGHSAADTYAAIDALGFYRAYLYSGDKELLHFSKLLLNNTKQFINWDMENPIPQTGVGLFGEAMNICIPRGHGVNFYFPWATYNQMEPIVFLEDIFGYKSIADIEKMSEKERAKRHVSYSKNRLYNK